MASLGPQRLRRAITADELELHYQPIVELGSGRPVAAEALLRWRAPDGHLAAPGEFWPWVDAGMAREIGHFVVYEATRWAARWRAQGLLLRISVNVDAREICADWAADVCATVKEACLPAAAVALEITETARMGGEEAVRAMRLLAHRGFTISLDDTGTGYNALALLRDLPLGELKIDRGFVTRLGDARNDVVLRMLVDAGHQLGLVTVAEGVETAAQAERLAELGVARAQGYLYGRPLPPEEFLATVRRLSVEQDTVDEVVRALRSTGASPASIASALNQRGFRTASGRRWCPRSVAAFLTPRPDLTGVTRTLAQLTAVGVTERQNEGRLFGHD